MSLKVWLPLTGTLENKGCSNVVATNNGATVDSVGKIGSCYSFDGSDDYISLTGTELYNIFKGGTQQFSICFWVYHADATRGIIFGDYNLSGSIGFNVELTTNHGVRFYWNGSPDKNFNSTSYVAASGWTHITITYNGTVLEIYKDGTKSTDKWSGTLATKNKTSGVYYLGRDSRTGTTVLNGKLNDFRLYDHCLSATEVHEISQGLVLYYKLDTQYFKSGTNLVTDVTKGGQTTKLTDGRLGVVTSGTNADTYFTINLSESITNGTTYHFSCDASGISEGQFWNFPLGAQNNTSLPCKIYNGHNEFVFTANDINWGTNRLFMDDLNRPDWEHPATFYNFILTKDATYEVKDSSGYGHNGTSNNIVLVTDSARFNNASQFNGTDSYIKVTDNDIMIQGMEALTINLWAKSSSWPTNGGRLFSCTESGGFNSEGGNSGYWRFPIHVYTNAEQTSTAYKYDSKEIKISDLPVDSWVMITWVYDTTGTRTYINGTLHHTYTNTSYGIHFNKNARLFLGCEANTANPYTPYYNGQMSDFRLYATTLSADDIKQLYQVSAKVDNLGRLHTFEAIETKKNLMFPQELNRTLLTFGNGLTRYTQANCQVTLDEEGYHIYRPPNALNSSNGGSNNMWGGLKLTNASTDSVHVYNASIDNIWGLQTGHTYLWAFHAKGQSTNSASLGFNHNMGNGVSNGCAPAPTILVNSGIPTNFQGEKDCFCIFTIGDAIVKTSTSTSAGFTSGSQYLSYRHFTMGYGYSNTGELGTDLHLTDFRLYDITNYIGQIKKTGITNFSDYVERNGILQIRNKAELLVNNLIER